VQIKITQLNALCGYPESPSRLRICAGQLLPDLAETILISSKNGIYQQIYKRSFGAKIMPT
jgi:hypothetical protein